MATPTAALLATALTAVPVSAEDVATSSTSTPGSSARAGTYTLIDEPGALYVLLRPKKSSLFGFLAHRHAIQARGYTGEVSYDPADPQACRISVDVPVAGLVVDPEPLRKQEGFEKDISKGDIETVTEHMLAEDQLFAEKFGTIQFRSERCDPVAGRPDLFRVTGVLGIRGVDRKIQVPVKVTFSGSELRAESDFSEVHESFGFDPYSAFAGTIQNAPMIQFRVRLRGRR